MWMLSESREDKGRETSLHKHIFSRIPTERHFIGADVATLAEGSSARTQEHIHVQVEQSGRLNHSPMFFWWTMGFCQGLQRMKGTFPSPSIIQVCDRRVDCIRGWIHFRGHFTSLIKAEFSVYLNRSYSVSSKLAGLAFAGCWGVGCLRVGSKRCMPSNTPLSSSNRFEQRPTEPPARAEFRNSCRDCTRALLC